MRHKTELKEETDDVKVSPENAEEPSGSAVQEQRTFSVTIQKI
jgi:hypothetical protein